MFSNWTGGHPYLTQKLCDLISKTGNGATSEQMVDRIVEEEFLTPEAGRTEHNLTFVRDRILRDSRKGALLRLYLRIVRGEKITDDTRSPIHTALKLSGLMVARRGGALTVRNRIYEQVFTERWAKEAMPANWNRRVAVASMAALLLGFGIWYQIFLPRPYIEALQSASEDYPAQAYAELHKIPGYAGKADELLAKYWDRRAIRFAAIGDRDQALFARLQGLTAKDSDMRRRETTLLIDSDYTNLISTYRHGASLSAVAFSPDGKLALTGSFDRTARLWRTDNGEPVGKPLRHENSVTAVAFSPDGNNVLVATQWWIHLHSTSNETLTATTSRLLPGTWTNGYRWLNESGTALQIALRAAAESVSIEALRLDIPEAEPITGKPDFLAEEWQRKLALKFEADKIVPLWEVPLALRDSGSRF